MANLWKIVKESSLSEVLSISGGALAGLGLAKIIGVLNAFPGMIIMVPGFMGLRGNILGAMSARIGTALHTGLIEPKFTYTKQTLTNILASTVLSGFVNTLIGIFAYIFCAANGIEGAVLWKLMLLGALSGVLAAFIISPFTLLIAITVFRKGVDPDNVMGPVVTSIGDITALLCLFIVAKLVLGAG
ncbi:MAG: magnesium transporter [Thermoproteota archaeon]|nr:magnesium transporter [Thermoproteota archaeon]